MFPTFSAHDKTIGIPFLGRIRIDLGLILLSDSSRRACVCMVNRGEEHAPKDDVMRFQFFHALFVGRSYSFFALLCVLFTHLYATYDIPFSRIFLNYEKKNLKPSFPGLNSSSSIADVFDFTKQRINLILNVISPSLPS